MLIIFERVEMETMTFVDMFDNLKSMADHDEHEFDDSASDFGDVAETMFDDEPHNPDFHFDWNDFAIHYNPDQLDNVEMKTHCGQLMLDYVRLLSDTTL